MDVKPSESHKSWLGKLARTYHEALTPETRSYLESRGLAQDAVDGALLGLVSDPDPAHEAYRDRLSIPYITPTGVVGMRFRCLEDHDCKLEDKRVKASNKFAHHAKYEGVAGAETHIYNVQALHDADIEIGLAEGEIDALVATSAGLPTAGCPGAETWKPYYFRLFDDFKAVYVLGDGDAAGRRWAAQLVPNIPGAVSRVQPKGYDVSSYVVEFGAEKFLDNVHLGSNPDTQHVE